VYKKIYVMKTFKTLAAIILVASTFISKTSSAQNDKLAIGVQYSAFTAGASVKMSIGGPSQLQATINPISAGDIKMNFYGARYIYNFSKDNNSTITPYAFGGVGLISWKMKLAQYGMGLSDMSDSFLGYSAGAGVEGRLGTNLALSGELGYGKMNVAAGIGVAGVIYGVGLHYYIK
jgi:hypothetical protein